MQIRERSFAGVSRCLELTDGRIELVASLDFGPRILYCGLKGGENFFRVFDNLAGADKSVWNIYGGHRLWIAPEIPARTKVPDNDPVNWRREGENTVILEGSEEPANKLVKRIAVTMEEGKVKLRHTIVNTGLWAKELSVWSLSVFAPGTTVVVPQEKYLAHGTGPGKSLLPVRPLVLWGYTDMADPRFTWGTKAVQMREAGGPGGPLKFGVLNTRNFAAAVNAGGCFVKRFEAVPGGSYPDMGCNWEFYTSPGMLEMETLSPMYKVEPGSSAVSCEEWELYAEAPDFVRELL